MERTSTILNNTRNYLPLACFAIWVLICSFEYSRPVIDNPLPFILITICIIGYKFNIRSGKILTGILLFTYLVGIFKIAPTEGNFKLGFTINEFWIGIKFKTAGIFFCSLYYFIYRNTITYQKTISSIGSAIRNAVRFMINPEEK